MDKTVDTGNYLSERAERSNGNYLSLNNVAYAVILVKLDPRVVLGFLVAKGYPVRFPVKILNVYLDNVAGLM